MRIVPNPLPVGRCAAIRVEVQDDEGYVSSQLTDGSTVDSRRFKYEASDRESFRWQGDKPTDGYLCVDKDAKPGRTMVTVTLPDGLSGSVELTSIAAGQSAAPVQYPPQGRIRAAGYKAALVPAKEATPPPAEDAPAQRERASVPISAFFIPATVDITSDLIVAVGAYFVPATVTLSATPITAVGAYFVPKTIAISTDTVRAAGAYPPASTANDARSIHRAVPPPVIPRRPPHSPIDLSRNGSVK